MNTLRFLLAFWLCLTFAPMAFAVDRGEPAEVQTGARVIKGRSIDKSNPYAFTAGKNAGANARAQFKANADAYRAAGNQKPTGTIKLKKQIKPLANTEKNKSCMNGNYSDCY